MICLWHDILLSVHVHMHYLFSVHSWLLHKVFKLENNIQNIKYNGYILQLSWLPTILTIWQYRSQRNDADGPSGSTSLSSLCSNVHGVNWMRGTVTLSGEMLVRTGLLYMCCWKMAVECAGPRFAPLLPLWIAGLVSDYVHLTWMGIPWFDKRFESGIDAWKEYKVQADSFRGSSSPSSSNFFESVVVETTNTLIYIPP